MLSLRAWLERQDPQSRASGRTPATWLSLAVFSSAIIALGAFVPVTRRIFDLQPVPMFAALAALLDLALPVSFYERKREIPRRLLVTIELSFALVM